MKSFTRIAPLILLTLLAVACSPSQGTAPSPLPATETTSPSDTPVPPTATTVPTSTSVPTPIGIPMTMEEIVGVWKAGSSQLSFSADGVILVADLSIGGVDNEEALFAVENYTLEEGILTTRGISGVCKGITGTYSAWINEEGNMVFQRISDECTARRGGMNTTHRRAE